PGITGLKPYMALLLPPHPLTSSPPQLLQNFVVCRLHRYCLKPYEVPFDNVLLSKFLRSRSEGSLGDLFPRIFDHL
ncbi:hypothetical protein AVEN_104905-1, partial [Araneus ventricosus]